MKPDVREKLAQALESGAYSQTCSVFRDPYGFCVLGVLVDLFIQEHPGYDWNVKYVPYFCKEEQVNKQFPYFSFMGEVSLLPKKVRQWSGISWEEEDEILVMNDKGLAFNEISKLIRDTHK